MYGSAQMKINTCGYYEGWGKRRIQFEHALFVQHRNAVSCTITQSAMQPAVWLAVPLVREPPCEGNQQRLSNVGWKF